MKKLRTALILLKTNKALFFATIIEALNFLFPDRLFLQILFFFKNGTKLDLKSPKLFSEKIQWLKLYNRNPLYTILVDKYAVKDYVAKIIGEEHVVPTLGVWNDVRDIDFEFLPSQFVLKTTNGGGGDVVICKDKEHFDKKKALEHLGRGLKKSIYKRAREWPYKNVQPRVIAEKYLENESGELIDYKFFCFSGKPQYCQVIRNRYTKETIDFYDMNWRHMPFVGLNPSVENGLTPVEKPLCLYEMIDACEKLSNRMPFVRVDFYVVKGKLFFGEMTFYPNSGFGKFRPLEWNSIIGNMIDLNMIERKI